MDEKRKLDILDNAKRFFKEKVVAAHKKNLEEITLSSFNVNPFLRHYLSNFAFGNAKPESVAKALLYPRVLGTSITTIFGTQMQHFCSKVLSANGSKVSGIDVEFNDHLDDMRHKYCQLKAGPNCINKDDIKTVSDHFKNASRLAKTNQDKEFNVSRDCIVGTIYGEEGELSGMYRTLAKDYLVYPGKKFWHSLTGEENFYSDLIGAFGEVALGENGVSLLNDAIQKLANEIESYQYIN
ncbi:MAG: restriction endonuclease [Betaproteobacteria bacterium]|nr:restriction endonuclease [Betaproteobacteria bacterium]